MTTTAAGDHGARRAEVVVVGAGHNGLVAACYLAKAGADVLVLERWETPGGMTSTNPMAPEAPDHLINEASIHASLFRTTNIDAELELSSKYGLRQRLIDPAHVHLSPEGESIAMWRDANRTVEEIKRFSRRDARKWLELSNVIAKATAIGLPMMQTNPVRPAAKNVLASL
jgi:phytoene dehydrogenase-like protein